MNELEENERDVFAAMQKAVETFEKELEKKGLDPAYYTYRLRIGFCEDVGENVYKHIELSNEEELK